MKVMFQFRYCHKCSWNTSKEYDPTWTPNLHDIALMKVAMNYFPNLRAAILIGFLKVFKEPPFLSCLWTSDWNQAR